MADSYQEKQSKIGLESYFLLQKYLTFQNSGTTNQTHMKLGPVIYHLNTFFLSRNEAVNPLAGEGAYKEPLKLATKLTKYLHFYVT